MNEGTKLNFIRVRLPSSSLAPSLPPSLPSSLPPLCTQLTLPPSLPPSLLQEIGMVHMRVAEGLNSRTQLLGLLAKLCSLYHKQQQQQQGGGGGGGQSN
jgi:hypothetical protein